jgi:hypothetical protein
VTRTLDYGKLYKKIEKDIASGDATTGVKGEGDEVSFLGRKVADIGFEALDELAVKETQVYEGKDRVEVWCEFPNGVLLADGGLGYRCLVERKGGEDKAEVLEEEVRIKGIGCTCVIGVNPHERLRPQRVVVSLGFRGKGGEGMQVLGCFRQVTQEVEEVSFFSRVFAASSLLCLFSS